jgi:hypothetical protein
MRRVSAAASTVGHLARRIWLTARRLWAGVRGWRLGQAAAPSTARRQYVFGGIGRKAFDAALRQRRRARGRRSKLV